jgi:putative addiction module killer protein
MNYNLHSWAMIDLKQTEIFRKWRLRLKDDRARALIASRLDRLAFGNAGDVKPVGQRVSELRIDYGPGYRVYFQRRGRMIVLLLCGGDKRTQHRDIETAKRLAAEWSEESGPKSDEV